jgi:outer membrane lipoprotein-sorting protein
MHKLVFAKAGLLLLSCAALGQSTGAAKPQTPTATGTGTGAPAAEVAKPESPKPAEARAANEKAVEQAINELKAAFDAMKSYTCNMHAKQFIEMGNGNFTESDHVGPVWWQRQNEKICLRQEQEGFRLGQLNGDIQKRVEKSAIIVDGEFYYRLSESDGKFYASKNSIIPATSGDPDVTIRTMMNSAEIKLMADEKHEGADCYVFETAPRREAPLQPMLTRHYYRKDCGVLVLRYGLTANGQEMFRVEATDMKLNVDIDPDKFKFELPPGVQLTDNTKPKSEPAK